MNDILSYLQRLARGRDEHRPDRGLHLHKRTSGIKYQESQSATSDPNSHTMCAMEVNPSTCLANASRAEGQVGRAGAEARALQLLLFGFKRT